MALNRGFMGLKPCPVCYVGKDDLHDCGRSWPLRDGLESQRIVEESRKIGVKRGENLLKAHGLRGIDVHHFHSVFDRQNLTHIFRIRS
jgi:hypothetical protein